MWLSIKNGGLKSLPIRSSIMIVLIVLCLAICTSGQRTDCSFIPRALSGNGNRGSWRNYFPSASAATSESNPFSNSFGSLASSASSSLPAFAYTPYTVEESVPANSIVTSKGFLSPAINANSAYQPLSSTNNFVAVKPSQSYSPNYPSVGYASNYAGSGLVPKVNYPSPLIKPQVGNRKRSKQQPSEASGPTISIGGAPGGGTAIRFGKAQITFKKGQISVGPASTGSSPKKYKKKQPNSAAGSLSSASSSRGISLDLGQGGSGRGVSISFGGGSGSSSSSSPARSRGQSAPHHDEDKAGSEGPGISFGGGSGIRLPSISFGNGGLTIGGGGGQDEYADGAGKTAAESSYPTYHGKGYGKSYYKPPPRPRIKLKLPHFPKTYIESNLKLPPLKVKLHASPRVKITTGTKDPLEPKPVEEDPNMQDIFLPPEPFPKKMNGSEEEKKDKIPIEPPPTAPNPYPYPPHHPHPHPHPYPPPPPYNGPYQPGPPGPPGPPHPYYPPPPIPGSHPVPPPGHAGHPVPPPSNYHQSYNNYESEKYNNNYKYSSGSSYKSSSGGSYSAPYKAAASGYSQAYQPYSKPDNWPGPPVGSPYATNRVTFAGNGSSYPVGDGNGRSVGHPEIAPAPGGHPGYGPAYPPPQPHPQAAYPAHGPYQPAPLPPPPPPHHSGYPSPGYSSKPKYGGYPKEIFGKKIVKYNRATNDKPQLILDLRPRISLHSVNETHPEKKPKHKDPFFKLKLNPIFLNRTEKYGYGSGDDSGYGGAYGQKYPTSTTTTTPAPGRTERATVSTESSRTQERRR
uniref:DUF4766 domain-containing protein n=1 Tax=Tetranychus urticae TaxID=32264 RepID=T1KZY0_TETUR